MRYIYAFIVFFMLQTALHAQDVKQQRINLAIDASERICLVGSRYKFSADVSGAVTITKLLPGGQARVIVDNAQGKGSQFFENETVRRGVDADIRECMKSQWPTVLQQIEAAAPQKKVIRVCYGEGGGRSCRNSGSYSFNCEGYKRIGGGSPATYSNLKNTHCGNDPADVINTYNVGGGRCGWTEFTITCNP